MLLALGGMAVASVVALGSVWKGILPQLAKPAGKTGRTRRLKAPLAFAWSDTARTRRLDATWAGPQLGRREVAAAGEDSTRTGLMSTTAWYNVILPDRCNHESAQPQNPTGMLEELNSVVAEARGDCSF